MGYGSFDHNDYAIKSSFRSAPTTKVEDYMVQKRIHTAMDPNGVKFRESCDSLDHPVSTPIAVFFDVTGSMGHIPAEFAKQHLGKFMGQLVESGSVPGPQVLVGAIGDAETDYYPFQAGQFESNNMMDEDLTRVYLEGNGGGNGGESYHLAWYWAANHTKTDSWDKRKRKGILFTVGDERSLGYLYKDYAKKIFGSALTLKQDASNAELLAAAEDKWFIRHLLVPTGQGQRQNSRQFWHELLGPERVIDLPDPSKIAGVLNDEVAKIAAMANFNAPVTQDSLDVMKKLKAAQKKVKTNK